MIWQQQYDPMGSVWLSTLLAALPVVCLLGLIALGKVRIHVAALLGVAVALSVAVFSFHMPVPAALGAAVYGAAYGLFPIGWIVLNVLFLYELTVKAGLFEVLRRSLSGIAPDPRVQLILIAFSLGAFIEGMAGFGAPVAITGAILIQLGFKPLEASVLALIANTAPVAFGSLGIPITTLAQVTGMDVLELSKMAGRQLPVFSVMIPFWVVAAYGGWRAVVGVWPAAAAAGLGFAIPQFLVSNFHGPWLVDNISGACSIASVILLLRFWKPAPSPVPAPAPAPAALPTAASGERAAGPSAVSAPSLDRSQAFRAWLPWMILSLVILVWGLPQTKALLEGRPQTQSWLRTWTAPSEPVFSASGRIEIPVTWLHGRVQRSPPVAPVGAAPEKAVFTLNTWSATGTGILLSGLISGWAMGLGWRELLSTYGRTLVRVRWSLVTIAGMLAVGNVTKYSGVDATLGLALAGTGVAYPFFGTLLGWLGVALTGSDTASNVLFGSLQKITAERLGLSPELMGAANSTGGVMGKMIDAQSIVVASTATGYFGREGDILRRVFWHSLTLASLVGIFVTLQAYVPPFTHMVVGK
jgi:lactate permease